MKVKLPKQKYPVGTEVLILRSRGYTGTVIAWRPYLNEYFLDCHPGAMGGYEYIWMTGPDGVYRHYAGNWVPHKDLRRVSRE